MYGWGIAPCNAKRIARSEPDIHPVIRPICSQWVVERLVRHIPSFSGPNQCGGRLLRAGLALPRRWLPRAGAKGGPDQIARQILLARPGAEP